MIPSGKYELELALEDKVYSKTYYIYQLGSIAMDETPTKIKSQEL